MHSTDCCIPIASFGEIPKTATLPRSCALSRDNAMEQNKTYYPKLLKRKGGRTVGCGEDKTSLKVGGSERSGVKEWV